MTLLLARRPFRPPPPGLPIPDSVNGIPLPVAPFVRQAKATALRASLAAAPATPVPANPEVWWARDSIIFEGWSQSEDFAELPDGEDDKTDFRLFKVLRLCTDYKVFPNSGANRAVRPPRIPATPDGWSCYKYVAWCKNNAREFFDLSTGACAWLADGHRRGGVQ